MDRDDSVILMVDVQEGLLKAMDPEIAKNVIKNILILLSFAKTMGIPFMATEQYPKGLGQTAPEIRAEMEGMVPIEKVTFSCCRVEEFNKRLASFGRKQIILCGIEAHVCILQTAIDLMEKGYEVYVVADGVCSRRKLDWEVGLKYLERRGAMISTTEIIAFQLLKEAGTEEFKRLSKFLK